MKQINLRRYYVDDNDGEIFEHPQGEHTSADEATLHLTAMIIRNNRLLRMLEQALPAVRSRAQMEQYHGSHTKAHRYHVLAEKISREVK